MTMVKQMLFQYAYSFSPRSFSPEHQSGARDQGHIGGALVLAGVDPTGARLFTWLDRQVALCHYGFR